LHRRKWIIKLKNREGVKGTREIRKKKKVNTREVERKMKNKLNICAQKEPVETKMEPIWLKGEL